MLIPACSHIAINNDLQSRIKQQISVGDFEIAIELVKNSELSNEEKKDYIKQIKQQQKEVHANIQQARTRIEALLLEDQWHAAILELEKLQKQYPHNQEIQAYKKEFQLRHKSRKLVLQAQLLVSRIEQVQKDKQLYIQRARINNKQPETLYYEKTIQTYSKKLSAIALQLAKRDDLIYAKQYSLIALNAFSSEYTQKQHNQILLIIEQRRSHLLTELERNYKQALARGSLGEARVIVQKMLFLEPKSKHYMAMEKQLEQQIQSRVEVLLQLGRTQYAQGNIEQAIKTWEQGLLLAPKHKELRRSLNHAYKARATLNRIRKQQKE